MVDHWAGDLETHRLRQIAGIASIDELDGFTQGCALSGMPATDEVVNAIARRRVELIGKRKTHGR